MTSYSGAYSKFYDVVHAQKPYSAEAGFIHACIGKFGEGEGRRLLELACGTGRHAIEFERRGYAVTATDASVDMLAQARANVHSAGSVVQLEKQDMRNLDLGGRLFDICVCLFDSLGYVRTNESLISTLAGVRKFLRSGGLFIFEFWHAATMLRAFEPTRVGWWEIPNGRLLRIAQTQLDIPRQVATVTYSLYELMDGGTYSSAQETHVNRFFLVEEMAQFLTGCGFQPLAWYAGFSFEGQIDEDTWHVIGVARRLHEGPP